jgi:hypothetical protein
MRMPEDLNEKIQEYAVAHSCTKAEAMSHFARAGIDLEERGGSAEGDVEAQEGSAALTGADETLALIQEKLDALAAVPAKAPADNAIIPVDIQDKIRAYSQEHECSDQDALAYYARIGIQASSEQTVQTAVQLANLAAKVDALAADNIAKGEQMKQMAEMLVNIRDYTKPEEMELEGEVQDDAEDVVAAELTDEEKQAIADEHTRKIVSDIMATYDKKQEERAAHFPKREASNQLIPAFVVAGVALLIALIALIAILTK